MTVVAGILVGYTNYSSGPRPLNSKTVRSVCDKNLIDARHCMARSDCIQNAAADAVVYAVLTNEQR
jgi:hypothetical protein